MSSPAPVPVPEIEQVQRRATLKQLRHSTEMSGGRSNDDARADQDSWARGDITLEQLLARTLAKNTI